MSRLVSKVDPADGLKRLCAKQGGDGLWRLVTDADGAPCACGPGVVDCLFLRFTQCVQGCGLYGPEIYIETGPTGFPSQIEAGGMCYRRASTTLYSPCDASGNLLDERAAACLPAGASFVSAQDYQVVSFPCCNGGPRPCNCGTGCAAVSLNGPIGLHPFCFPFETDVCVPSRSYVTTEIEFTRIDIEDICNQYPPGTTGVPGLLPGFRQTSYRGTRSVDATANVVLEDCEIKTRELARTCTGVIITDIDETRTNCALRPPEFVWKGQCAPTLSSTVSELRSDAGGGCNGSGNRQDFNSSGFITKDEQASWACRNDGHSGDSANSFRRTLYFYASPASAGNLEAAQTETGNSVRFGYILGDGCGVPEFVPACVGARTIPDALALIRAGDLVGAGELVAQSSADALAALQASNNPAALLSPVSTATNPEDIL